jgi:hypothetical protein
MNDLAQSGGSGGHVDESTGRLPAEIEAAIKGAAAGENRPEAALRLAAIANRATTMLHQLAREEANARKGQPDWGRWAALANTSRDVLLRTATSRRAASDLLRAANAPPPPAP